MCIGLICKFVLHVLNLLILMAGFIFIIFVLAFMDKPNSLYISSIHMDGFALILGVALCTIVLLGCIAVSCLGNWYLLTGYTLILIIILIAQVVMASIILVHFQNSNKKLRDGVKNYLEDTYENFNKTGDETPQIILIHKKYECCGINKPSDATVQNNGTLMNSCCPKLSNNICSEKNVYRKGCLNPLVDGIKQEWTVIVIMVMITIPIEISAAVLACLIKHKPLS